ncbi:MAG: hypothetical protein IBJ03_01215 [Gemmatimonadaceae bacterium]|nr:hypothetical protein [Gemmatimonadaceae bacterium]
MPATIIAFDGALFDTLPARRAALQDALQAEGARVEDSALDLLLPGRTFGEVVSALDAFTHDPTSADLVLLRVQRLYAAIVAHGVRLMPDGMNVLRDAQRAGHRIILRADSDRRHVEALLTLSGLETGVNVVRCADDPPRGPAPSLTRSWEVIHERLTRFAIPVVERFAYEATERTLAAAGEVVLSGTVATPH